MTKTVLAVDDSPSIRRMIAMTLGDVGIAVEEAVDGLDGLEHARARRYDAIITDQNMPNLNGLDFIRALRETPMGQGVPVIVLSTDDAEALKAQARAAGALGWMVKPFTPDRLVAVIRKVLG